MIATDPDAERSIMGVVRSSLRRFVPKPVRVARGRRRLAQFHESVGSDSAAAVFSAVYEQGMWSPHPGRRYSSGGGSHDPDVVQPYVAAVTRWVEGLGFVDAVDLGCGDFEIGAVLRPLFDQYVACDVVPEVLAENRGYYSGVDFRLVDIVADELPAGDVAFVRQVLQHLSNDKITRALEKIAATYPRLVLTEHLPLDPDFVPNVDIRTGPATRLTVGSGVDIAAPPFNVTAPSEVLCEVQRKSSRIRTTVYNFTKGE